MLLLIEEDYISDCKVSTFAISTTDGDLLIALVLLNGVIDVVLLLNCEF